MMQIVRNKMKKIFFLLFLLVFVSSCVNLEKETIPANETEGEGIVPEVTQNETVVEQPEIEAEPEPVPEPEPPQLDLAV